MDPRRNGEWVDPYVVLTVDEPVYEIDDPIHNVVLPSMRVIPCGPFYAAERATGPGTWADLNDTSDISEVNKAGIIKQQLAPVHVIDTEQTHDLYMEVPRLRRLLRKHTGKGFSSWKLTVDEEAALLGQLTWRVDASDPLCYGGAIPYGDHCSRDVSRTIFTRGAHLPMCAAHVRAYEDSLRSSRISR